MILVALAVLLLATGQGRGGLEPLLTAINAVIVSLAAMGAYEVSFRTEPEPAPRAELVIPGWQYHLSGDA